MAEPPDNESHERILDAAEELFSRRGYKSVRLRDIGDAVGMKHASLYYYAPGGKQQMFVAVMERFLNRQREGLERVIGEAGTDIRDQLHAVGRWLVSQPPMDLSRFLEADMNDMAPEDAHRMINLAFDSIRVPIETALERAKNTGQVDVPDAGMAAMALFGLMQSVHMVPAPLRSPDFDRQYAHDMTEMLLKGFLTR